VVKLNTPFEVSKEKEAAIIVCGVAAVVSTSAMRHQQAQLPVGFS
jgi:hypothetical protein